MLCVLRLNWLGHQHSINIPSSLDLQVGKVGTGRGRKRKSGEQASTKDLQLAGILHIMFLLANDEVNRLCNMGFFDRHHLRLYTTNLWIRLACHEVCMDLHDSLHTSPASAHASDRYTMELWQR